jgi:hypothetical protein
MDNKVGSALGIYVMIGRIVSVFKEFGYNIFMKFFGFGFFDLVKESGDVFFESLDAGSVWLDLQISFIN